jgi:tellurite resistance-related uncharacterized protein
MHRLITGYHRDEVGDWVAELSCGHGQHVRHRPPFQPREWIAEPECRTSRLGTPLDCPWCDGAELPEGLELVRSSRTWDERTVPAGHLRAHRIAAGTWGRITVHGGELRFVAQTEPAIDVVLGPGAVQAIPPEVAHEVQPSWAARFSIDFFSFRHDPAKVLSGNEPIGADRAERAHDTHEEGGESACLAHLLCPDCGVVLDRSGHVAGCASKMAR